MTCLDIVCGTDVCRSMLSDHYLASYIAALETLTEEAVLEEARTSNPLYNRAQDIL
jgi:hypothetical protein